MVDFNSNIQEPKGLPKLDKDYWQSQSPKKPEKIDTNVFDMENIIKTNFDVDTLNSVFNNK